jgi:hypothetical protein
MSFINQPATKMHVANPSTDKWIMAAAHNYFKSGGNRSSIAQMQAGQNGGYANNTERRYTSATGVAAPGPGVITRFGHGFQSNNLTNNNGGIKTFKLPGGHVVTSGTTVGGMKIGKSSSLPPARSGKILFSQIPGGVFFDSNLGPGNVPLPVGRAVPAVEGAGGNSGEKGWLPNRYSLGTGIVGSTASGAIPTAAVLGEYSVGTEHASSLGSGAPVIPVGPLATGQAGTNSGEQAGNGTAGTANFAACGYPGSDVHTFTECDAGGNEVKTSTVAKLRAGSSVNAAVACTGISKGINDGFVRGLTPNINGRPGHPGVTGTRMLAGLTLGMPSIAGYPCRWGSLCSNENTGPGNTNNGASRAVYASNKAIQADASTNEDFLLALSNAAQPLQLPSTNLPRDVDQALPAFSVSSINDTGIGGSGRGAVGSAYTAAGAVSSNPLDTGCCYAGR